MFLELIMGILTNPWIMAALAGIIGIVLVLLTVFGVFGGNNNGPAIIER